MPFASSDQYRVDFIEESTYNTVPADGTWKNFRQTGGGFKKVQSTSESAEIRPDRQTTDVNYGAESASGTLNFELSADSFDDVLEAGFMGTWTADKLVLGSTDRSFSFIEKFQDIGEELLTTGCVVNTINLSSTPETVTGSVEFIGKSHAAATGLGAPVYGAPLQTKAFDGFTATANIDNTQSAIVTGFNIVLTNNRADRPVIGNVPAEPRIGKASVTGDVTVHFEDMAVYNKWLNNQSLDLEIVFTDGTKTQTWKMANVKPTDATKDVAGDSDIFINIPIIATYDATDGSSLSIVRT